jgi:hypothetical protein
VLVDWRRSHFSELDASYEVFDVRTPSLRVLHTQSRGLVTDFGLQNRAVPFLHRMAARSSLTVVLDGRGRFDEGKEHAFLSEGNVVISDSREHGTEGYTGDVLTLEWDPELHAGAHRGRFAVERIASRDLARLHELAAALRSPARSCAVVEIFAVLRATGVSLDPVEKEHLLTEAPSRKLQQLQDAMSERIAALHESPTIEELAERMGWDQRHVNRQMAALRDKYRLPWPHWRERLHGARVLRATQLLSHPRASIELVARLAGFRAVTALYHAFANCDLPAPGRLAERARSDALGNWSELLSA